MPDRERPMHYMDVFNTPIDDSEGKPRQPDDWQPRVNITRKCHSGQLDNDENITKFSNDFAVKKEYIQSYLVHLKNLHQSKDIRRRDRIQQQKKKKENEYADYNWLDIIVNGSLKTMTISELNKYLQYHNLSMRGKKEDKVKAVTCDVIRRADRNEEQKKKVKEHFEKSQDIIYYCPNMDLYARGQVYHLPDVRRANGLLPRGHIDPYSGCNIFILCLLTF